MAGSVQGGAGHLLLPACLHAEARTAHTAAVVVAHVSCTHSSHLLLLLLLLLLLGRVQAVTDDMVARLFRRFPGMEYCDLKKDRASGKSKVWGAWGRAGQGGVGVENSS